MAPDFDTESVAAVEKIVGATGIMKLEEVQRYRSILNHCVDPKLLWPDVKANIDFFSQETKFDGGFTVKSLVSSTATESTFCAGGVLTFAEAARKVRNTLSHGKDQETSGVITEF
jgi:hypothetical protein